MRQANSPVTDRQRPVNAALTERKPTARSKVSNGVELLPGIDGRSPMARRYRDISAAVRTADGRVLFRPGGHGALIENLNDLQGDLLYIKNIDNIVPRPRGASTYPVISTG